MRQLMHSFVGLTAPDAILEGVRAGRITSFCLFAGLNLTSAAQARELNDSLHRAAQSGGLPPPLIGTDQEGGQLMAVTEGATELPGNMALGATRSPELAYQAGRVLARELLGMGFNLNFAPSVDINVNPSNPGVGTRSFGDQPAVVAELGAAMIRGMQEQGVLATAKHFPGHGDTAVDSHYAEPVITHPMSRLEAVELVPFRAALEAQVACVMSAHITVTALDASSPATISRAVMTGLLRETMGYSGLILTDALDMHAVAQRGHMPIVIAALEAGADLLTLAHIPDQLHIAEQVAHLEDPAAVARIDAARLRVAQAALPFDVVGSAEHREIAQTIAERAITLVKRGTDFPLRLHADDQLVVITPQPANLTPADTSAAVRIRLADALRRYHANTVAYELPRSASESDLAALLDGCAEADAVVVGTINAAAGSPQAALVGELLARGVRPLVVSMRTPYDLMAFPTVDTYLCTYSIREVSMHAAAAVLFGQQEARGVLPCAIPAAAV